MMQKILFTAALSLLLAASSAKARDQVRIVGSSTVFPFSITVAERFGRTTQYKTPIVESTGSGGGLKLFCSGVGSATPDIANASRRIKKSEVEKCAKNGVAGIIEVKIGYDGIVMARSKRSQKLNLSLKDIFLALAKDVPDGGGKTKPNPYKRWKDINPELPAIKIEVLGPPPTSGTRDAFVELAMEGGCKEFPWVKALKKTDKSAYKSLCQTIREDRAFIETGENDNLIVQKLTANPNAFGIFGFSFLDQNIDLVQGNLINNVEPSFENIASGDYPIARPLYFYAKKAHLEKIPAIKGYLAEFTSDRAWGEDGYLSDKGLIPMPAGERHNWKTRVNELKNLVM